VSRLGVDRLIVGREIVDRKDARCVECKEPFKWGVNVFTKDGAKEVAISGLCEACFDTICAEPEDEEDEEC
jgi:hypothetical protein